MKLHSQLPVAPLFFKHWSPDDREIGVVIAKAVFRRHADGKFRAEPQPEIAMEDVFEGDPAWTPLINEQDIAPLKRGTDLTISGTARAPDGRQSAEWGVEISIPDRLHFAFQVRGPSVWLPRRKRWDRTTPELVSEVPLSYSLAFGGAAPGPESDIVHAYNPAGMGLVSDERLAARQDIPIPQIGLMAEFMSADPKREMTVMGTGPIAKTWLPRRALAGTFDEAWQIERHPRMPHDFDPQYWNAAPNGLQIKDGLRGDEVIALTGLTGTPTPMEIPLPKVQCMLQAGEETHLMALDTVHLDLQDTAPETHTATLIWRIQLEQPERFAGAQIVSAVLEN